MRFSKAQVNIKRFSLQLFIIIFLAFIDQIIKIEAKALLLAKGPIEIIPKFLGLRYAENTGAAFSFMSGRTAFLSILTTVVIFALIIFLLFTKTKEKAYHIILPFMIAGGVGNLIDRIFRGYVIDYLEFLFVKFAIFNFADILVTCGAIAFIIYLIFLWINEPKNKAGVKDEGI